MSLPWYKQVSRQQWKTFLTTFTAWTLDSFDFTILTFVLIDIQQSFSVNRALAGALGTVTLLFRMVGGIGAGTAADRYGRKGPILSRSPGNRLRVPERPVDDLRDALRVPWPLRHRHGRHVGRRHAARARAVAGEVPRHRVRHPAGRLLAGLPAVVAGVSARLSVDQRPARVGLAHHAVGRGDPRDPHLLRDARVPESPVWLEQQRASRPAGGVRRLSLARLFDADLRTVTLHTSLLMGGFVFMYQVDDVWYPTLLDQLKQQPLAFLLLLNAGGMIGSVAFGWLSEKWGGRRGAATVGMALGIVSAPFYLFSTTSLGMLAGAWLIGFMRVRCMGHRSWLSLGANSRPKRAVSGPGSRITSASGSARSRRR